MVTGHSTFYNGESYDPCLGSIAGIMRNRVMWFNDQVLVERYGGKGTFIYATQADAPDPRTYSYLYSEGVYYDFVDPNGAHWHVEEAWYSDSLDGEARPQYSLPNPGAIGQPGRPTGASANLTADPVKEENKRYVWIVELSAHPIYDDFAGADPANFHTYYNFVNLVDTCKIKKHHNTTENWGGVANHTGGVLNPNYGHPSLDKEHDHETWNINLWVGTRPNTVPFGSVAAGTSGWSSAWATGYPESQASGANVTQQTNNGPNNGSPNYWEDP